MENPSTIQRCGSCKQLKDETEFSPSYRGKNGTWCRSCFAAYHRGDVSQVAEHEPQMCSFCSIVYIPISRNKPTGSMMFCSSRCKTGAHNLISKLKREASKAVRVCLHCGGEMPRTMRVDARFCSEQCNMEAHRRTRNFRRRAGEAAPVKPRMTPLVNLAVIAKRDGYLCGLCGKRVDMKLKHPDPGFASLDHLIPIASGGAAIDPANLRLAHLRCNLIKGAKARGEQLMIFG